jgi:hypothetical protein
MRYAHGLMVGVVLFSAGSAGAQQESVAETLFRAGREAMKQGAYAEACPKFAESQRLDPSPGTVLNLAVCEEGLGLVATAWARFRALLDTLDPADPRARIAREHAQALEPTLPRLRIRFEPAAPPGVVIRLDGATLGRAAEGVFMPIDPGEHRLEVSDASGSLYDERFRIALGDRLERALSPRRAPAVAKPPLPARPRGAREEPKADGASPLPLLGLVTAGAGVVALGVGTFFALEARSLNDDSYTGGRCDGNQCDPTGTSLRNSALRKADVATVLFSAGAALGVGGASLFFVTRRRDDATTRVSLHATTVGDIGLNASGTF